MRDHMSETAHYCRLRSQVDEVPAPQQMAIVPSVRRAPRPNTRAHTHEAHMSTRTLTHAHSHMSTRTHTHTLTHIHTQLAPCSLLISQVHAVVEIVGIEAVRVARGVAAHAAHVTEEQVLERRVLSGRRGAQPQL